MTPSPDILRDFSALQQACNELGKSNVAFADKIITLERENATLKSLLIRAIPHLDSGTFRDPDSVDGLLDEIRKII